MSKLVKHTDRKKSWNRRKIKSQPYQIEFRNPKKTFLIICEGENTEPEYFKSFPLSNAAVKSFGTGTTKTTLVHMIIDQFQSQDEDVEIWAVFDMDIKEDQVEQQSVDYNRAIQLAEQKGIKVAYSNDAFELWFVLHYQFIDGKLHREQYYQILSDRWNCNYSKKGKSVSFCRKIFDLLDKDPNANMENAILHAEKLFQDQKHLPFCDQNPCSRVYKLVQELNQYL